MQNVTPPPAEAAISDLVAISHSVITYHGDAARAARMDALYRAFLPAGALAFDIGAHVGDRAASFRRLGARVVCVEPQAMACDILERLFAADRDVTVVCAAVGAEEGEARLRINARNPTVSTLSDTLVTSAGRQDAWQAEVWDREVVVPVTTVDRLIAAHGPPRFIKIDVEGLEAEVLAGLTHPVPALSFEFTTLMRDEAVKALQRLGELGDYRFNVSLGESLCLELAHWEPLPQMMMRLQAFPDAVNSGDIYARMAA